MRYLTLCTDYDGTLATDGKFLPQTVTAIERLIASGRRAVLVTGRELDELRTVCPQLGLFEYVVAENGALLFHPATGTEVPLGERPGDGFVAALRAKGVGPISVGRVIIATWEPHETAVLQTIRDQGLELQVIFNKGAVMILPAGVNKATGLAAALERMNLSRHNCVGIGDAENDHALLALCECGVAVANALPTLKQRAEFVTTGDHGAGVEELIAALLKDDLASHEAELVRHEILLGADSAGRQIRIRPYAEHVLALGPPGSGPGVELLKQLTRCHYTCCVIDGRGDYPALASMVSLGADGRPASVDEISQLFQRPAQSCVVSVAGLSGTARNQFVQALLDGLGAVRQLGRPHWLALNASRAAGETPKQVGGKSLTPVRAATAGIPATLLMGERADDFAAEDLRAVNLVIACGDLPHRKIEEFCQLSGTPMPQMEPVALDAAEVLAWRPQSRGTPVLKLRLETKPSSG